MKTKDLQYFGISRQNKNRWKLTNDAKYNIVLILESLNLEDCKKFIDERKKRERQLFRG